MNNKTFCPRCGEEMKGIRLFIDKTKTCAVDDKGFICKRCNSRYARITALWNLEKYTAYQEHEETIKPDKNKNNNQIKELKEPATIRIIDFEHKKRCYKCNEKKDIKEFERTDFHSGIKEKFEICNKCSEQTNKRRRTK